MTAMMIDTTKGVMPNAAWKISAFVTRTGLREKIDANDART